MEGQYLNKEDLLKNIKYENITNEDIISRDTYNEGKLLNKFNSYDDDAKTLLLKCAIQTAIIGYGNRSYGFIRVNDKIVNITDIFDKYKILYNRNINEKYDDDTLTSRRLFRLLRFHIQEFIIKNNRPSYLWNKYSIKDKNMIPYCFPGAEHLVETKEQGIYLYQTYHNLDLKMNTKFSDRLKRTYQARNLFTPLELNNF